MFRRYEGLTSGEKRTLTSLIKSTPIKTNTKKYHYKNNTKSHVIGTAACASVSSNNGTLLGSKITCSLAKSIKMATANILPECCNSL